MATSEKSYLEQIKEKVSEAKLEELERFKQLLEEDCVQDFKDTLPNPSAIVYLAYLQEQGINTKSLVFWLEDQGFNVQETKGVEAQLVITYQ